MLRGVCFVVVRIVFCLFGVRCVLFCVSWLLVVGCLRFVVWLCSGCLFVGCCALWLGCCVVCSLLFHMCSLSLSSAYVLFVVVVC